MFIEQASSTSGGLTLCVLGGLVLRAGAKMFRLGLRKSELARVQIKHYDGRNLTVFGKGGKVRYLPVVEAELREAIERHILDRQPSPDEFLLYPEKLGPEFYGGPVGTIWEDRQKQMSSTAMHR